MDIQLLKDLANYVSQINRIEIEYLKLENIPSDYMDSVLIPIKSSYVDTLSCWSEQSDYDVEPHHRFQDDMDNELREKIYNLSIQLLESDNVSKEDFKTYIDSLVSDLKTLGEYKESDYYGNFSTYVVYKVDMNSLLTNMSGKEMALMYEKFAQDIRLDHKPKMKI